MCIDFDTDLFLTERLSIFHFNVVRVGSRVPADRRLTVDSCPPMREIEGTSTCRETGIRLLVIGEIAEQICLVSFMDYDLGFFDRDETRVDRVDGNPFSPEVLPLFPL